MKRSQINEILREADAFIRSHGYVLPPFAHWTAEQMRGALSAGSAIGERHLGWDITDYGGGRFDELGLVLFTTRNGSPADLHRGKGKLYAEKIMISRQRQLSPMHRHISKTEDIINRGGGALVLKLYTSDRNGMIDQAQDVLVPVDGEERRLEPGGQLKLQPGESVTLFPNVWHAFWAEGDDTLIGEVSTVNDDKTDNIFRDPVGRFPKVDEDTAPLHLLVSDYPEA